MTPVELTAARKALGWSERELARRLGVHWNTITHWEHGRSRIPAYLPLALQSFRTEPQERTA